MFSTIKRNARLFLLTMLVTLCNNLWAQIYPVQVQSMIAPPYPRHLESFAATGTNRTNLFIYLADRTEQNYKVCIRLVIDGVGVHLESKPAFYIKDIALKGGTSVTVTNDQICSLFSSNNLVGTELTDNKLPDGLYKITFEVYDQNRFVLLSNVNVGYQMLWISQYEPPYVNMPGNGEVINSDLSNSVTFQWTPRCLIPVTAKVHYKLRIVPMLTADIDPVTAITTSANGWTIPQTGELPLTQTSLQINPLVTPLVQLQKNTWYAYQVQIVDDSNILEFRNEGKSEVGKFFYGTPCATPEDLSVSTPKKNTATLTWENTTAPMYEVQYREDKLLASWNTITAATNKLDIPNLGDGKTFQFKIRAQCAGGVYSDFSPIKSLTLSGIDTSNCQVPQRVLASIVNENGSQKLQLTWTDIPSAQKFKVTLTTAAGKVFEKTVYQNNCQFDYGTADITGERFNVQVSVMCGAGWKDSPIIALDLSSGSAAGGKCQAPIAEQITVKGFTNGVTQINWEHDILYSSYTFNWRPLGTASKYVPVTLSTPPAQVEGCVPYQYYQYQIIYHCNGGGVDTGETHVFLGDTLQLTKAIGTGTCYPPSGVRAFTPAAGQVQVVWLKETDVSQYQIQIGTKRNELTQTFTATKPEYNYSGKLDSCYYFRVRSICGGAGGYSQWSTTDSIILTNQVSSRAETCPSPTHDAVQYVNGVQVYVLPLPDEKKRYTGFTGQLRPQGSITWSDYPSKTDKVDFINLNENTKYEYRIAAYCNNLLSEYCAVDTFRTYTAKQNNMASDTKACGQSDKIETGGAAVLSVAKDSVVTAAAWKLTVDEATPNSTSYNGSAHASVSFYKGARANFTLDNCSFDKNKQLVDGVANMTSFKIILVNPAVAAAIKEAIAYTEKGLDYIDEVQSAVNGVSKLLDSSGSAVANTAQYASLNPKQKLDAAYKLIVSGGDAITSGNSSEGAATLKTAAALIGEALAEGVKDLLKSSKSPATLAEAVLFRAHPQQVFGFDNFRYRANIKQFDELKMADGTYPIPFKSLEDGQSDKVLVVLPPTESLDSTKTDKTFVRFFDGDNHRLMPSDLSQAADSTYATITVPAGCRKVKATTMRTIEGKQREVVLGQLNCERFQSQTRNVILVSVNKASLSLSNPEIETALNSIYASAVSKWKVSSDLKEITIADVTIVDDGDNELCSKYTGDMKTLIQAYKDAFGDLPDENTVCLFLCAEAKSGSKQGYMPLKGRFGFLFTKQLTDAATTKRTAAHELAHGTFRLWHTFSSNNKYLFPERSTDNLMDYNNGAALYKYQWEYVHDPESMWFAWTQDEAEGAQIGFKQLIWLKPELNNVSYYLTPAGFPIYVPNTKEVLMSAGAPNDIKVIYDVTEQKIVSSPTKNSGSNIIFETDAGILFGFIDVNGQKYGPKFVEDPTLGTCFIGYYNTKNEPYIDKVSLSSITDYYTVKIVDDYITTNGNWQELKYYISPLKDYVKISYNDNGYKGAGVLPRNVVDVVEHCRYLQNDLPQIKECNYVDLLVALQRDRIRFNPYGKGGELSIYRFNDKDYYFYCLANGNGTNSYWVYDNVLQKWSSYIYPELKTVWDHAKIFIDPDLWLFFAQEAGHTTLDLAGLVPVFGAIPDGINAVWYVAEGDNKNAALCAVSMVPVAEYVALTGKFALKFAKSSTQKIVKIVKDGKTVKLATETADGTVAAILPEVKAINAEAATVDFSKLATENTPPSTLAENAGTDLANEMNASPELSFNLSEKPERVKAWITLHNSGTVDATIRTGANKELDIVSQELKSREIKDVAEEIKNAGGFDNWKAILAKNKFSNYLNIQEKLSKMSSSKMSKFISDFGQAEKGTLEKLDANEGELVASWEKMVNAALNFAPVLRKDIDILTSLSKFDDELIAKIGKDDFDKFLAKLIDSHPTCKTCGKSGDKLVGDLDNVLNDFHDVVTNKAMVNGEFISGFKDFMKEAGEQASKAKAASLTLNKMANNWDELTEGRKWTLSSFEGKIPDIETNHRFDLQFERTEGKRTIYKSVEMKNWKEARSIEAGESSQFYAHIASKKHFEYYFSSGLQDAMKVKFENIFKDADKAKKLWDLNPEFFMSLDNNITKVDDVISLAKTGDLKELIKWVK